MSTPLPLPAWLAQLRERCGTAAAAPRTAADAVNVPMIRRWCEAMGERNPLYLDEDYARTTPYGGIVAPPAMLEVWTMGGYQADGGREHGNLVGIDELDAAGFTAVVATNLEQEYLRYLRPGDRIRQQVFFEAVSEEKRTALGSGHFLNYRYEFTTADGTPVGRMRFRILKFRPAQQPRPPAPPSLQPVRPRPAITRDSAFFWEGLRQHRLLVRRCTRCQHLHHPPGPMCPQCHAFDWDVQQLCGRGVVHSYVIVHQPQLPGFSYPLPVALIELAEGVRLVANLTGMSAQQVHIGMPVEVEFVEVAPDYVLYAFHASA
jgi:uncharacterized OB-fold protein